MPDAGIYYLMMEGYNKYMTRFAPSVEALRRYDGSRPLIASHKGRNCGLVAESTRRAFNLALRDGADIIETDVSLTKGGEMILMHGPNLDRYTDQTGPICERTIEEIRLMHNRSCNGCVPDHQILELPDFLGQYKGQCLINLDRCFFFLPEAWAQVCRYGMEDQAILKSGKNLPETFAWLRSEGFRPQFMPIVDNDPEALAFVLETAAEAKYPAVELVFDSDEDPMIAPETIRRLHELGVKVWVNALTLARPLCGGHDDICSLFDDPDKGWGWLCDHGVDVIQTDFVHELKEYLDGRFGPRE